MSNARDIARRVVRRAASAEAFATLALAGEIERAGLDGRDAALATELAMGALRHQRRIDFALAAATKKGNLSVSSAVRAILRVAAYEILYCSQIPARASVNEAAEATRAVAGAKLAGFVNALLRVLSTGEPALPTDPRERLATIYSLPDWILSELEAALAPAEDDELTEAARALSEIPAVCLRANRSRTSVAALSERLQKEVPDAQIERHPFAASALRTQRLGPIAALAAFREGHFTVQDVAAQRVSELISPRGVSSILDCCAGVGGKTTHVAELFGDAVAIDAVDIAAGKLELLSASAERLGLSSIRATFAADMTVASPVSGIYDLVLLDAPCTGLGVLRRHPEAKWRLGPSEPARLAVLQKKLLAAAAARVASNGQLLYSVCTFSHLEGRGQIADFIRSHADFEVAAELVSWPHRDDADAFYAARLVRRAPAC